MLSSEKAAGRGKSEEKGQQILSAAAELFVQQGFDDISMDQIARHAGVSKQTVYSHYGSKEELFQAAIACKCEEHQLDADPDDTRPVREYLREFVQHFTDLLISPEVAAMHRVCIAGADKRSKVCSLFWDAGPERLHENLQNYLARQVRAGKLNIDNLDFAAQQLLFMVKGEAHMKSLLALPSEEAMAQLPDYLDSCVEVFMRAYGVVAT